jgi:hypothetical protein
VDEWLLAVTAALGRQMSRGRSGIGIWISLRKKLGFDVRFCPDSWKK